MEKMPTDTICTEVSLDVKKESWHLWEIAVVMKVLSVQRVFIDYV